MRPDVLRAEAVKAIAEINVSQARCRALLRKTAASPKDLQIEPGQNCAHWRWQIQVDQEAWWMGRGQISSQRPRRYGSIPATPAFRCHLRSAHGFENWQPLREDIAAIKDGATSIQKDLWEDHRADGPPREEDEYDYDLEVEMPQPLALPLAAPSTEQQQPAASQQQHQDTQTTPRPQPAQQHNTSMEYHQRTTTNVNTGDLHLSVSQSAPLQQQASTSRFGMTRQDRAQYVPLRPGRGRSRTPSRELAPASHHTTGGASTATAVAAFPTPSQAQQQHLDIGEMAPVTPPKLQAADYITPTASQAASNSNPQPPASGDTTPQLPELVDLTADEQQQPQAPTDPYQHMELQEQQPHPPNPSTTLAGTAAAVLQREGYPVLVTDLTVNRDNESDGESSNNEKQDPAERMLTRKEAKALDREIPWRQILSMPKEKIQAFIDSAIKEENGWKTWGSVEPVHEAEAKAIMTDPKRRRRVLKSRACYHNKSRDPSKPIAKTRVVALGHLDPDLYKINRDAPTPSRTSEYLLLSIYAAGVNGVFQNETLGSSGQETSAPRSCRGFAKTETNRLANKGKETATADLATLYSAISYAKETSKQGLVFQDVPINKATVVWANAVNCSSQQGVLTLLTTPHCSQVTAKANLVDWKSNRSARVCRSTLAAEAMACDDSVDRAYFTNIILYELLHAEKAHRRLQTAARCLMESLQRTPG